MDKILRDFSFSLLSGIFTVFALSFSGFIAGLSVKPAWGLIGILVSFLILNYCCSVNKIRAKITFLMNIALAGLMFFSLFFAELFPDNSWDGLAYHQPGIRILAEGYNPVFDNIEEFMNTHKSLPKVDKKYLTYVKCYPKFSEIFASNVYLLTKKINTGKAVNHLSMVMAFLYCYYVLSKKAFFGKQKDKSLIHLAFSFILVYNPIVLCQFASYYNDGLLYLCFLMAALSVIDFYLEDKNEKIPLAIFIMSSVILANIKLGGILCFLCLTVAGGGPVFFKKKKVKPFCAGVLFSIFLILLSGINPYFTNIKEGHHPFYPVLGKDRIDFMSYNLPASFSGKPAPYKFFVSTFSRVSNISKLNGDDKPVLKIPFSVHKNEICVFTNTYDMRISGFGALFSGVFLLTLACLFLVRYRTRESKKLFVLILAIFGLPVLLNPENWWARYVPYLWAFSAFSIMGLWLNSRNKFEEYFSLTSLLLMYANSLLVNIDGIFWLL